VWSIPVIAYETADEEFGSDAVGFGEVKGVVYEQCVADGLVDYAIENMCKHFALNTP